MCRYLLVKLFLFILLFSSNLQADGTKELKINSKSNSSSDQGRSEDTPVPIDLNKVQRERNVNEPKTPPAKNELKQDDGKSYGERRFDWQVILATCTLLLTLLLLGVHRKNRRDSVRPDFILDGWNLELANPGSDDRDYLRIKSIKNIGKGPASDVKISIKGGGLTIGIPGRYTAIIPVDEKIDFGLFGSVHWHNVEESKGSLYITPIKIVITSRCSIGNLHKTVYEIHVYKPKDRSRTAQDCLAYGDHVAKGVIVVARG